MLNICCDFYVFNNGESRGRLVCHTLNIHILYLFFKDLTRLAPLKFDNLWHESLFSTFRSHMWVSSRIRVYDINNNICNVCVMATINTKIFNAYNTTMNKPIAVANTSNCLLLTQIWNSAYSRAIRSVQSALSALSTPPDVAITSLVLRMTCKCFREARATSACNLAITDIYSSIIVVTYELSDHEDHLKGNLVLTGRTCYALSERLFDGFWFLQL